MKPSKLIKLNLKPSNTSKQYPSSMFQTLTLSKQSLNNTLKTSITFSSPTKIPKNVNEYKHLLETRYLAQGDLDWTLDLRLYDKQLKPISTYRELKTISPSFYDADLKKFRKTKSKNSKIIEPLTLRDNPFSLSHLVKGNANLINESMLNFETTLRCFGLPKGVKTVTHKNQWKNFPFNKVTITNENKILPPLRDKEKANLRKIDKYVLRNYITLYKKKKYGNDNIQYKQMIPDKSSQSIYLGEHLSLKEYNNTYESKNIQNIRHILANHSNSLAKFENGLRGGYELTSREYNNKLRQSIIEKNKKLIKQKKKKKNKINRTVSPK